MKQGIVKAILLAVIPIAAGLFGIFGVIKPDHKAEVDTLPAGNGFAAEYTITASPNYRWTHGTSSTTKVVIGMVLFIVGGALSLVKFNSAWTNIGVTVLFIVVGMFCIFGKYGIKYYDVKDYQRVVGESVYQVHKGNLDELFDAPNPMKVIEE